MLKKIIKRPVLATVISILLVILGVVAMTSLPITKFPEIAPPTVTVTANYPGASAEVIAKSVAPPLENAINGVENMDYLSSTASNDGSLMINVVFKLGTDPDQASVNVQNRVSQATSMLPSEVNQIGVTTMKRQNSIVAMLTLYADGGNANELFLENYAKINIVPELKRITGVGDAQVFGNKDYSMRVWMDPQRMSTYNITPEEIAAAIQSQNKDAAPGKFGESSKESIEYTIRYQGKYTEPEQYENIILRANNNGSSLLLKDVARVEFGSYTNTVTTSFDNKPAIMVAVFQTAGSNANAVEIAMNNRLKELSASFPPGVKYKIPYSSKESLDQSIKQVLSTLLEAFILVFIVVFIFLQDFRSTLIPAIAVPVSIVGTFFFMQVFGFSINLLTLFALVLAIGIVVDDAIVVVEAVHAKMEKKKLNPRSATMSAMSEITGAIISITLVMSAVFIPVAFMDGPTGVFYQQFALTLAMAILISAVNALTLSPALCAILLKQHDHHEQEKVSFKQRFFTAFNAGFDKLTNRYAKSIIFLVKKKSVAFAGLALFIGLFVYAFRSTPTGFIPDEDQSFLMVLANDPPGASLDRTGKHLKQAENMLKDHPAIESIINISGLNMMSFSTSSSAGAIMLRLKPLKERGDVKDINQLIGQFQGILSQQDETTFLVAGMPTVPGFGNTSGLEVVLQDRNSGTLQAFNDVSNAFVGNLMQRPEIAFAFTTFNASFPQYEMKVNEGLVKQLSLNVSDVLTAMQAYYGSMQASDFNRFGKYYRVVLQAEPGFRADPKSIETISIKNKLGQMVPLKSVVELKPVSGPENVEHFNLFNAINLTIMAAPGFSTGQAMAAIEEVGKSSLPQGFTVDWKGMAREERGASGQTAAIFGLCIIFVYFLLSAQYESYILPFAVLLAIPVGLLGVFWGISLGGLSNNIYVQVALVMLIGLLAKNAILIVEFALQRRKVGKPLAAAAIEGAKARLRPILMTSLAFIAGLLPLLVAVGPSAIGNHSIGYAAVFGMLAGTVLGVFFTPILFVVFQYLQERLSGKPIDPEDWEYEQHELEGQH
ncbi:MULTISPECIES: efflux RND transporter permease subunit [Sphingobacterium]|jgi:hydrophobe/amphiphile efflux-1 (HAE1) family protein|uniref:Efflux RND transporter permease subunit n=1 Tax=Sphingobacterium paramultivorum TaxID=2886510 RepID=A0A7G5DWW9_9SPHI|nr:MULTISPECIES: efflux RND transporter permease subunit [Sphingobacterium]MCS4163917.1 hydrophobe/amphiphile efflux-1 (HAE1) family protein [Sphingobacterium sp. BIGb0116]QMV66244.1 efflux RND transporter permease subunit [Sphingobacterium paramultivorum]WSO15023.1 efflux RND transporter permease subunit [Sphingobacterium paramultivorum]